MTRWIGPVLFVAIWLGLLGLAGSSFLRDPGTLWHTRVGDMVLAGDWPRHDTFSFTYARSYWIPQQWLGEAAMAGLHRVGGLDALLVVAAAVAAALFAWATVRLVRTGLHPVFAIAVGLLSLAATASQFHARPLLMTLVGMAVTLWALVEFEAGRIGVGRLFWLVPLYAVWTNVHGGVLGGLTTLGLAIGGWFLAAALGWRSPVTSSRTALGLVAVGVACGLTAFVTPYGAELQRMWFVILAMPRLTEVIQEHRPFDLADPNGAIYLAFAAVYLAALAGVRPGTWRVVWLVPLFWFVQGFFRVRHGPIFAVAGLVVLADLWPRTRWAAWLAAKRPDVYTPPAEPPTGRVAVPILATAVVCVVVALTLQALRVPVPVIGAGCARLDPKRWPVELLDAIRAHEPGPDEPNKVFNDYLDGPFLIYFAPGYKVFVDDRCEMYGEDWLLDLVAASQKGTDEALERWQGRFGPFDFALTRTGGGFDDYFRLSPGRWECVQRTADAAFYRRR